MAHVSFAAHATNTRSTHTPGSIYPLGALPYVPPPPGTFIFGRELLEAQLAEKARQAQKGKLAEETKTTLPPFVPPSEVKIFQPLGDKEKLQHTTSRSRSSAEATTSTATEDAEMEELEDNLPPNMESALMICAELDMFAIMDIIMFSAVSKQTHEMSRTFMERLNDGGPSHG